MLAKPATEIPRGAGWLYEPKWDGFRAIVFRDGADLHLQSRKEQPLERYFPELVPELLDALPEACVVDGEIVIAGESGLDFEALLQRIHPARSRVEKLAAQAPASFVAFDLLAIDGEDLRQEPLSRRRARLERALGPADRSIDGTPRVRLTPQTGDPDVAAAWLRDFEAAGLDGVVAKGADLPYLAGERVMVKVKRRRTVDCVVGGLRRPSSGRGLGSVLLGLYDEDGVLHHVGHVSSLDAAQRRELQALLRPLEGGRSFGAGRTPGAPSRWAAGRDTSWIAVTPKVVVEVEVDHLQAARFRHAARLVRLRPDKAPRDCTMEQLAPQGPARLADVFSAAAAAGKAGRRRPARGRSGAGR